MEQNSFPVEGLHVESFDGDTDDVLHVTLGYLGSSGVLKTWSSVPVPALEFSKLQVTVMVESNHRFE